MISIYLFNSILFVFNFQKDLFTLIVSKEFITKFQFWHKKYFYLLSLENNKFLQFYLQKYFDSFSFKKSEHNFICKRNFN